MSHHHHDRDVNAELRAMIACETCRKGILDRNTGITPPSLARWFRLVEIHGAQAAGEALTSAVAALEAGELDPKEDDGLEA